MTLCQQFITRKPPIFLHDFMSTIHYKRTNKTLTLSSIYYERKKQLSLSLIIVEPTATSFSPSLWNINKTIKLCHSIPVRILCGLRIDVKSQNYISSCTIENSCVQKSPPSTRMSHHSTIISMIWNIMVPYPSIDLF